MTVGEPEETDRAGGLGTRLAERAAPARPLDEAVAKAVAHLS